MASAYHRRVEAPRAVEEIEKLITRGEELAPDVNSPAFTQWRTTMLNRVGQLLPKSTVVSQLSLLRFRPSQAEYFNAMGDSGPDVDPERRFGTDMQQTVALLRAAAEELEFASHTDDEVEPMGNVSINRANIATMMQEIQREFDKHPIRVPVRADHEASPVRGSDTTINYNGPVVQVNGDHAQIAYGNETVDQTQNSAKEIAPGLEAIAQAVAKTLERLPEAGLGLDDQKDAEAAGREVLDEVTTLTPDRSKIRRGVNMLKGLLAPVAIAAQTGAAGGAADWAGHAIGQLSKAL